MNLRNNRTIAYPPTTAPEFDVTNEPPPPTRKNRSKPVIVAQKLNVKAGKKLVRGPARGSWTKEVLDDAIESIEEGIFSIRRAGLHYGIPQTTLRNHLYGKTKNKFGSIPKGLTIAEEKLLLQWAFRLADEGRPVTLDIMKQRAVVMTVDRPTCFKNGLPGKKWWKCFRGRHPEIALRTTQCVELQRVKSMTTKNLQNFYSTLRTVYDKHNFDPTRVWNCDETGIQAGCRSGMRVIARKGMPNVTEHVPKSREWMTVLVYVNASGYRIPNLYVFKGKRMRDSNLIAGCEPGSVMAYQKKAWITDELFGAWLDHFKKTVPGGVSKDNPHLLICDGHGSHVNMATILKAREIGLQIVQLPPHTSHKLQPLDVSCFRPFKQSFRKLRAQFMHTKYDVEPTKEDLATIVSESLTHALTPSNICAGFCKTGIWPWELASVQAEALADKMEEERTAACRIQEQDTFGTDANAADVNGVVEAEIDTTTTVGADAHVAADGTGTIDSQQFQVQPTPSNIIEADAHVAAIGIGTTGSQQVQPTSSNAIHVQTKPKSRRLKLPESLKGKLLVTSDEMVQAKLEYQRQCEEAAMVRQQQLEEKKRIQAERKEAKEREKKRREENKRVREERKAALEKDALDVQHEPITRSKRARKKTRKLLESEQQDKDEDEISDLLITGVQVNDNALQQIEEEQRVEGDPNLASSQSIGLEVCLPIEDSQSPGVEDDEVLPCSLEGTHLCSWDVHCRKKGKYLEMTR